MPIENHEDNDVRKRDEARGNPSHPENHETTETPELKLTIAERCINPDGDYVGLTKAQRERLGVEVGDTVELFDEDGSLGIFCVGRGEKALLKEPTQFRANVAQEYIGTTVRVRKAITSPEKVQKYEVKYGIEIGLDPKSEEEKRHLRRQDIIGRRKSLEGLDPEIYISIPTALAGQMGIKAKAEETIAPISKGRIKDANGTIHEIAIVPSGTTIGLTTKAAQQLKIPQGLKELRVRVEEGVLVMN